MKFGFWIISILIFGNLFSQQNSHKIPVNWVDEVDNDFTFINNWNYPEGVYINQFGQLSCDGICPPKVDHMKDSNGKIIEDSLGAFYEIIDTSHLFHSFQSSTDAPEWTGSQYISSKIDIFSGEITCVSSMNIGTHVSLELKIVQDSCFADVRYISVRNQKEVIYTLLDGEIQIDRWKIRDGILQSEFDLTFVDSLALDTIQWSGLILSMIDNKGIVEAYYIDGLAEFEVEEYLPPLIDKDDEPRKTYPVIETCDLRERTQPDTIYVEDLISYIESQLYFPDYSLYRQIQGLCVVDFDLDCNNELLRLKILKTADECFSSMILEILQNLPVIIPKYNYQDCGGSFRFIIRFKLK